MHYEFNIALNGKHLFATHKRSVTDSDKAEMLKAILLNKFPVSEGYEVTLSFSPGVSYGMSLSEPSIKEQTNDIYTKRAR